MKIKKTKVCPEIENKQANTDNSLKEQNTLEEDMIQMHKFLRLLAQIHFDNYQREKERERSFKEAKHKAA
jgi:hypothetical protein